VGCGVWGARSSLAWPADAFLGWLLAFMQGWELAWRCSGVVGCAACVVVGIGATVFGEWGYWRVLGAKLVFWKWVEVVGCWVRQL
jgi:hypothetical protein